MAEVAGLALGVLGIAGLFTSCIENFDIIVRAKNFGEEFDLLCTQLSLLTIRLALWGETLGLMPPSSIRARRVPYNHAIDRHDIKPSIIASLHQLLNLLSKADVITERYALECTASSAQAYEQEVTQTPRGMLVLRDSFQKFKERIRKNQTQKSVWKVTRWSVHDYAQFETLVDNIRKLLDDLESITNALGVLERQRELLLQEVDSVSDAQSLSLLQEVGSSSSASIALRVVSETASVRLTIVGQMGLTALMDSTYGRRVRPQEAFREKDLSINQDRHDNPFDDGLLIGAPKHGSINMHESIPQHQRWMDTLLSTRPGVKHSLAFSPDSPDDTYYGKAIESFKGRDYQVSRETCYRVARGPRRNMPHVRRVYKELWNIRHAAIPFISAVPVGDALDRILACIEGPPGTPYHGGIFWLTVRMIDSQPPAMRFHTRIYHPNIDHTGKICADYMGWWYNNTVVEEEPTNTPYYAPQLGNYENELNLYSLGALLVALCGLLVSPNVEDPLVPEIAQTFVTDYDEYCRAARLYTQRYASASRPAEEDLVFLEDSYTTDGPTHYEVPEFKPKTNTITPSPRHTDTQDSTQTFEAHIASVTCKPIHERWAIDRDREWRRMPKPIYNSRWVGPWVSTNYREINFELEANPKTSLTKGKRRTDALSVSSKKPM
ncbi:ubiquitin-conjugating enzyme E2-16 kDa [Apiospora marii]|uniref:Ubiquitin-conjugating enzyme E2-16 kDa n=1 Tax=Apiospora marii TaxID=335849 RepID=A0ABR1STZ2_9PEZI